MNHLRITSANAGAALGVNPYKTPEALIRQMVRQHHGSESEFSSNIAVEYGKLHEPLAVMEYLGKTGQMVSDHAGMFHPNHQHISTLGFSVNDEGSIVSVRCPFSQRAAATPVFKSAKEQPHYYATIQLDMFLSGVPSTEFYQWAKGGDSLETVPFDKAWLDENLPRLYDFYEHYLEELDNPAHLAPLEAEINTALTKKMIDEYDKLCITIDNSEARKKELLAELVAAAKNQNATFWGRRLSKIERKGSVSYAKLVKEKLPGVDLKPYTGAPTKYWMLT